MHIVGFIKTDFPEVLINPVPFQQVEELYGWLREFFNEQDWELSRFITRQSLDNALLRKQPIRFNFTGYKVALLLGEAEIIQNAPTRYVYTDLNFSAFPGFIIPDYDLPDY